LLHYFQMKCLIIFMYVLFCLVENSQSAQTSRPALEVSWSGLLTGKYYFTPSCGSWTIFSDADLTCQVVTDPGLNLVFNVDLDSDTGFSMINLQVLSDDAINFDKWLKLLKYSLFNDKMYLFKHRRVYLGYIKLFMIKMIFFQGIFPKRPVPLL